MVSCLRADDVSFLFADAILFLFSIMSLFLCVMGFWMRDAVQCYASLRGVVGHINPQTLRLFRDTGVHALNLTESMVEVAEGLNLIGSDVLKGEISLYYFSGNGGLKRCQC